MHDHDHESFRILYGAHYRTVCRYLAVRAEHDVVEDAAAETFLVAWRRRRELPEHVVPWLLNTASKCLANQRRSRERSVALLERLAGTVSVSRLAIEEGLDAAAQCRALVAALGTLSARDRELMLLRHWDELAPRDVAVVLHLSPMLARTRLNRAQQRLQVALRAELARQEGSHHWDLIESQPIQRT